MKFSWFKRKPAETIPKILRKKLNVGKIIATFHFNDGQTFKKVSAIRLSYSQRLWDGHAPLGAPEIRLIHYPQKELSQALDSR